MKTQRKPRRKSQRSPTPQRRQRKQSRDVLSSGLDDSKVKLLQASQQVFSQRGYEGATVKDIASLAGVNVSLVSYYFDGKEGIYRACIESMGRERLAAAERMLKPVANIEEFRICLRLFLEEFANLHLSNGDCMKIIHRDYDNGNPIAMNAFKGIFMEMFERLQSFIGSARKAKVLRHDFDIDVCAALLFGGLVHSLRMDHMRKEFFGVSLRDPKYFDHFISHFVDILTTGLMMKEGR